jgi:hypothetical protein
MDQLVVPQRNARSTHPGLDVEEPEVRDVGHLALPMDSRTLHGVAGNLARSGRRRRPIRDPEAGSGPSPTTFSACSTPVS